MTRFYATAPLAALLVLGGCASAIRPTTLPAGQAAYDVAPPADLSAPPVARALQPGDVIAVAVFREPDFSAEKLVLDELGNVQLPLLGELRAGGNTPVQFSQVVAERLGARYLRHPRVTVALLGSPLQTVAVEGQVENPGVFPVGRDETLLSALARAGSTDRTAKLDEIVIFRRVNGQRMGGVFNLDQIRTGKAPDPQILDGDVVVVGFSQVKGAFRDFLQAAPLFNLFLAF